MASSVQSGCSARNAAAFSCRAERYSRSAARNFCAGDMACTIFCASVFMTASDCNCFSQNAKKKQIPRANPALGMTSKRLFAFVEEGFEAGVAGAADGQASAVGENGQAAVLAVGLDAHEAFKVHDVGAVDAHEAGRIEAGFQAGDGLLLEMLLAQAGQRYVVVLGFRVVELDNWDQRNLGAVFHHEAF